MIAITRIVLSKLFVDERIHALACEFLEQNCINRSLHLPAQNTTKLYKWLRMCNIKIYTHNSSNISFRLYSTHFQLFEHNRSQIMMVVCLLRSGLTDTRIDVCFLDELCVFFYISNAYILMDNSTAFHIYGILLVLLTLRWKRYSLVPKNTLSHQLWAFRHEYVFMLCVPWYDDEPHKSNSVRSVACNYYIILLKYDRTCGAAASDDDIDDVDASDMTIRIVYHICHQQVATV